MSDYPVPIEPSVITEVKTITSFKVHVSDLILFSSVTLRVEFFNEQGGMIDLKYTTLSGDDYKNWATDDSYVVTKVAERFGLIIKPPEPAPAPAEPAAPADAPAEPSA